MRSLWLTLCVALVFASSALAAPAAIDRGLVVRVQLPRLLVLRELDGSRIRFAIRRKTVVTLDGRRVQLAQLQRGDVAVVLHNAKVVLGVRAFRP